MDADAARRLLDWFAGAHRDLPWRGPFPRDPYLVLVSEVMLQQTQVDRVLAGFEAFVERFPSLVALAAASEDEVVEAFSGMGYYSRARRLHRAARTIVESGGWPSSAEDLADLPGFGAYTSAALAAFSFAGADPPVDGNVARIAARILALPLPHGSNRLARSAGALARELHSQAPEPAVFEALMELGATVCTPRAPRCAACPLRRACAGQSEAERFPLARAQRNREDETWAAVWLARADGAVLLRPIEGLPVLAGLWLPPVAVVPRGGDPATIAATLGTSVGHLAALAAGAPLRHSITHRRITVLPFVGAWRADGVAEATARVAFRDPAAPGLPTSSLLAKLRRACTGPRQLRIDDSWDASEES